MIKNRLGLKIWISFTLIIILIYILMAFMNINSIRNFFTEEIYKALDDAQNYVINNDINMHDMMMGNQIRGFQNIRNVQHVIIDNYGNISSYKMMGNRNLEYNKFFYKIWDKIQKNDYSNFGYLNNENNKIYYKISRIKEGYLISFTPDTYKKELEFSLFRRLLIGALISSIIVFFISYILSRYLTVPILKLEKTVSKISKRQWEEEVKVKRNDEIGDLANSIELLRKRLIENDDSQQKSLQYISHELKTPLMVIRSYTQSIRDGIFPKGNLQNTLNVIDEEMDIMEKRVRDLIYYSKLDFISKNQKEKSIYNISRIAFEVSKRFENMNENIKWIFEAKDINFLTNEEQIIVLFENIYENQIRYTKTFIKTLIDEDKDNIFIIVENDGEKIKEENETFLFDAFYKGNKGKFGLGLSLVYRIVKLYGGTISIYNSYNGVKYDIKIKK
ncbi:HAMP domain-containing histidine kinase [Oceanotoga sp. DSM 15011]|uniref:sensor histidine kinase n=1 Tax=Oceanotoga sp. DSM 15011 TaxID=2984951 RepID=UPI0021F3D0E9|nr:HAMP domain-containing sensor histidine kinase [Oceanotoga sp. DSM 15011]UYO99536.1 HAMP domain-containing histidine kinase [Oceanotoga sp. DSM 15011]